MIARVALPIPRLEPFDYAVPVDLKVEVGHRVRVPLGRRHVWGIVVGLGLETPRAKPLLPIERTAGPVVSSAALDLITRVAQGAFVSPGLALAHLVPSPSRTRPRIVELALPPNQAAEAAKGLARRAPAQARVLAAALSGSLGVEELRRLPGGGRALSTLLRKGLLRPFSLPFSFHEARRPVTLTPEQARAVEAAVGGLGRGERFLLMGPPGSGKTEVYLEVAREAVEHGRAALLLEPEVSLLPQLWTRTQAALGFAPRAYFGELPPGERWRTWQEASTGSLRCAVGTRSAVFLPLPNLGLVVLDEEGEPAYKQDEMTPYYHARAVAELRGEQEGTAVLLGSAAPAVDTYFRAERGELHLLRLRERLAGTRPEARAVPRQEAVIGPELAEAMARHLARNGQILLFHNRLGFYTGASCRGCRAILRCPLCELPLVFHRPDQTFRCHACGRSSSELRCPRCGSSRFRLFGVGTERVEHEARRLFPGAAVARLDTETARNRDRILSALARGEIQILVGSQMVGKGLDFPNITLVGIINADQLLSTPDFRAGERTYQLIATAAGRAGRGERPGEVLVQTDHVEYYPIRCALDGDYLQFYREELRHREALRYPPFVRLVRLLVEGSKAEGKARSLAEHLARGGLAVLGPARLSPRRGIPRAHLLVRGGPDIVEDLARALPELPAWLKVDPDPLRMW